MTTMKAFVMDEAERRGVRTSAIYTNIWRGRYPGLKVRRKNQRVVFVIKIALPVPGKNGRPKQKGLT